VVAHDTPKGEGDSHVYESSIRKSNTKIVARHPV